MTTIAFCADVHVANHRLVGGRLAAGMNVRCEQIITALGRALTEAERATAKVFVVLGDLFDSDKPTPQMIAAVGREFLKHPTLEVILLAGNHDLTSAALGHNALAPLGLLSNVTVAEQPAFKVFGETELLLIPFQSGPAHEWFPQVLARLATEQRPGVKERVLGFHLGIHDKAMRESTPGGWLEKAHDALAVEQVADLCHQYGIRSAFAGNWHSMRTWEFYWPEAKTATEVVQTGALVPTGWDNPGIEPYGHVCIWRSHSPLQTSLVLGPRFINVESVEDLKAAARVPFLYARRTVGPGQSVGALSELTIWAAEAGVTLAGTDVRVDRQAVTEQAQKAAASARSAETLESSLAAYVEAMPLPDGVSRERVFNLSRRYLG